MNKKEEKSGIRIKVKNMILNIKNLTDYKYWKSVYPNATIVL